MENREALSLFLENGMQLDKKSLSYIVEKQLDERFLSEFISLQKEKGRRDISSADIVEFEDVYKKSGNIVVLKKSVPLPANISVEELVQDRIVTYDSIRKLLQYRWELVNPISINKIGRGSVKFSLIAEVVGLERINKTITLQDNTGTVTASAATIEDNVLEQVDVGDILGFLCESGTKLVVAKIINPDTSLFRERKKPSERAAAVFVSGLVESGKKNLLKEMTERIAVKTGMKYEQLCIFGFEDHHGADKNETDDNKNTFFITGADDDKSARTALLSVCGTNILLSHKNTFPKSKEPASTMTGILKKRMINHQKIGSVQITPFIIDPAPDIFVTDLGGDQKANYKNTILLSIDKYEKENTCWVIDLQTNECIKVNLE